MSAKKRGRPPGSSRHRESDDQLLRSVAFHLVSGRAGTPTEAIRNLLGPDDEAGIRRLQRRWQLDGQDFIDALQRQFWDQRWEMEARELEAAAPDFFAKVTAFAQSKGGTEVLAGEMRFPNSPLMSLGIMKLWELIERHSPLGAEAADRAFARSYAEWCRHGSQPDTAFLERFAELCLNRAATAKSVPVSSEENSGQAVK